MAQLTSMDSMMAALMVLCWELNLVVLISMDSMMAERMVTEMSLHLDEMTARLTLKATH